MFVGHWFYYSRKFRHKLDSIVRHYQNTIGEYFMSTYQTKISVLRAYIETEDWDKALSLAHRFPRLGEHKVTITRAYEALVRPQFYEQLGYNTFELIEAGKRALKERYGYN
jgi:hypothetical protein